MVHRNHYMITCFDEKGRLCSETEEIKILDRKAKAPGWARTPIPESLRTSIRPQ